MSYVTESRKRILVEHGFTVAEYQKWREKWNNHRKQALAKGVNSTLSFGDYVHMAHAAGLTSVFQIGQNQGQYQVGRFTDSGDYTEDSCRFITVQENQAERQANGGTAITVEKTAQKRRGQTKETNEGIRKMADTLSGRSMAGHQYLSKAGLKRGKPFELISPEGVRHVGVSLYRWCKENGMSQATMNCLLRDESKSYKGWKGRYLPYDMAEALRTESLLQVTS